MNKIGAVVLVVVFVILTYLVMLVVIPWLSDITTSVNATLQATSNMSQYPGTSEFLVSIPLILYFVPATIGLAVIVFILRDDVGDLAEELIADLMER